MSEDHFDVTTIVDMKQGPIIPKIEKKSSSFLVTIHGSNIGQRFEISDKILNIGRSTACEIFLDDDSVSRNHCKVQPGSKVVLVDQNSTNGTYVNSTLISARPLNDGDTVQVGRSIFKYLAGDNIERAYHEEIYRLKTTDGLTGAHNKRTFDDELKREFHRFLRHGHPLSLLMIDIDYFKRINDTYGHLAGDMVLSQLSKLFQENLSPDDLFCRYGGEEFALILPETELKKACTRAEELRKEVEGAAFVFDDNTIPITVSIGVTEAEKDFSTKDEFVAKTDECLYRAKRAGRNQVVCSTD